MNTTDGQTPAASPSSAVCWWLRAVCVVALGVSSYLAWTALNASEVFGCTGDVFDCGHVLSSAWSKWFSVPVSVPAVALYASLLAVLTFAGPSTPAGLRQWSWRLLTAGAVAAVIAAVWFTGLQIFVIKHLCPYCLVAHACSLLLGATVLWYRPLWRSHSLPWAGAGVACAAVLIGGQLMTPAPKTYIVEEFPEPADQSELVQTDDADADLFSAPGDATDSDVFAAPAVFSAPMEPMETSADPGAAEENQIERDPSVTETLRPTQGTFNAADETRPAQGQGAAQIASTLLSIWLPVARTDHRILFAPGTQPGPQDSAVRSGAGGESTDENSTDENVSEAEEVRVPAKPEPRIMSVAGNKFRLNAAQWPMIGKPTARFMMVEMFDYTCPHCRNTHRTIKQACQKYGDDLAIIALAVPLNPACNNAVTSGTQNVDACELARLSVAVWRVNPAVFSDYHDWMFDVGRSRTASEARAKAEQMVGREALQKELASRTPSAYIARHVELYQKVGAGAVPKMLFSNSIMTGEVNSLNALSSAIDKSL